MRGAELGVWQGATLEYLLRVHPALHMIGVDHWQPVGTYAGKDMTAARAAALAIAARYPDRCRILESPTVDAAINIDDASLDFVFVDASHDQPSVSADIRAWRSKVRAGGLLTGHDADWPGVTASLNLLLPGWRLLRANVWAWEA